MLNEEFIFFDDDDSSASSEHANIPRVLNLHEAPKIFSKSKRNLFQSVKLQKRSNIIINKINNKYEEKKIPEKNEEIKGIINKTQYNENSIINLDNKLPKDKSNNFIYKKSHKYKKLLLKTQNNENEKEINSYIKSKKEKNNKIKEIKDIKKTFEKKITSKFESYDKKIINSFNKNKKTSMKQSLFKKKLIKNNYNIRHSLNYLRINTKDDFNHNLNTEIKSKNKLMNSVNFKHNKENNIYRYIQSSKAISSFKFDLLKPKNNKNNINSNLPLEKRTKKINKKINDNNRLTLPFNKEINKKEKDKEKFSKKNNNISIKVKVKKYEQFQTENNNLKHNNDIIKGKKLKTVHSLNDILKEQNKYNIKSHYVLSKAGLDEDGRLKINQDSYLFIKEINGIKNFNIFGVLDGHGPYGHFVSQLISRYLQLEFQKKEILDKKKDIKEIYNKLISNKYKIIKDIFIKADIFLREQDIESKNSGTTCVLVIQLGEHIICANTGDSRAILIYDKLKNKNYQVFPLSVDSKPELKEEKERIIRMGGIVEKIKSQNGKEIGPFRVWNKSKEYPGLAMSRSIGDFNGKNIGIIPDPQIIETNFGLNINYIVICSDGVWEFLDNKEVMNIGNIFYEKNNPRGFCKEIIEQAIKCWKKADVVIDDITILTVFF